MLTTNQFCRRQYGEKLYKISLNGGFTCPNRDGTLDSRGCIFCSAGGSGDFAPSPKLDIDSQIEEAKAHVASKFHGSRYIAYFQAYTNTYAPINFLRKLYFPVAQRKDIAVVSIATRPDCLSDDVLVLLKELQQIKPVWVELGLQTVKTESIAYIRRGYDTAVYNEAVRKLRAQGIHCITHVILGLPGESEADMLASVQHAVDCGSDGIKLQLLHVLAGTDLAADYQAGNFREMSLDAYVSVLKKCVALLPPQMVVHRLTGDGPKKDLLAPLWSGNKKHVLNVIRKELQIE